MNVLDLLFPPSHPCVFCGRKAESNGVCGRCWAKLSPIEGDICERCGRPFAEGGVCEDCVRRKDAYFIMNRSAVRYNEMMKEALSLYKFRGLETLADHFASLLERAYRAHYGALTFDAIVFVPLHERRLRERGFNQAEQLAERLGRRLRIPVRDALLRTRYTEKLSKKQRGERLRALGDSFQTKPSCAPFKRALLVDDVYTTGTTINACAKALAKNGTIVYALTVAR